MKHFVIILRNDVEHPEKKELQLIECHNIQDTIDVQEIATRVVKDQPGCLAVAYFKDGSTIECVNDVAFHNMEQGFYLDDCREMSAEELRAQ